MFLPTQDLLLIAIDPSTRKCGYSEFIVNLKEKKIKSIKAETIEVDKLANNTGLDEEITPKGVLRYYKLRNELTSRFKREKPSWIAYEGPFMNMSNPSAFLPLASLMTVVRDAVIDYNLATPFLVYQPQVVKMSVGVAGKKGKEVVLESIKRIKLINDALESNLDDLDDNGVDAIVVGFTFFLREIEKLDRLNSIHYGEQT